MAIPLGINCIAYSNSASAATPTWVEQGSVTSVQVSNSLATADITRRGGNGYRQKVGTLAEGDVTFDLIYDTTDTFFDAIDAAYRGRTTIDMWFASGDEDGEDGDGVRGFRAAFAVTDFSENQELEDAVRYSVTLSVSGTDPVPGYWEKDGGDTPTYALVS